MRGMEADSPTRPVSNKGAAIAAALVEFQSKMPTVAKSKTAKVTHGNGQYSYTYADLADVTAAAMPLLVECGLSFTARPRANAQGGYELVGVLLHTSGESIEGSLPVHGRQPQELGSALTYARRYLLGCLTGIVTEDDDDANLAADAKPAQQEPPKQDWPFLRDAALSMTNLDTLREFWVGQGFGSAPEDVRDAVQQHVAALTAQAGGAS